MFEFTPDQLKQLCDVNSFQIPSDGLIFFGLRGATPMNPDNTEFLRAHQLVVSDIDYLHPRCVVGQWPPAEGRFAVFSASTVPHKRYVQTALAKSGQGANQLMTGCYRDYRKGKHKANRPTGHDAFRQTEAHPVRRTADDFDYDTDDRVEFTNPFDNIHAAWSMGVDHDYYASAGCQVIVGYPQCAKRGDKPDTGAWRVFKDNAYSPSTTQDSFPYILLNGRDAQRISLSGPDKLTRLRFGSKGELVSIVQTALQKDGYYEGRIDADFGNRTLRAVLEYQEATFGPSADDGIVGSLTASAFGIDWPD
jgi:hypothetical protein